MRKSERNKIFKTLDQISNLVLDVYNVVKRDDDRTMSSKRVNNIALAKAGKLAKARQREIEATRARLAELEAAANSDAPEPRPESEE